MGSGCISRTARRQMGQKSGCSDGVENVAVHMQRQPGTDSRIHAAHRRPSIGSASGTHQHRHVLGQSAPLTAQQVAQMRRQICQQVALTRGDAMFN